MWVHLELSCKALTWKRSHKSFPLPWLSLLRWYHPFQDRHCTCLTSRLLIKTFLSIASLRVLFANRVHPEKDVRWQPRVHFTLLATMLSNEKSERKQTDMAPFSFFSISQRKHEISESKTRKSHSSDEQIKTSFLSEAGIVWLKHKFRRWQRREQTEHH